MKKKPRHGILETGDLKGKKGKEIPRKIKKGISWKIAMQQARTISNLESRKIDGHCQKAKEKT